MIELCWTYSKRAKFKQGYFVSPALIFLFGAFMIDNVDTSYFYGI